MGKTLSLVMIVKNEEATLQRCLDSVVKLVDELIIVDTGSHDSTKKIAKSNNAKLYDFVWNGSFSDARNFALQKSTSDWNLVLDADEYMLNDYREPIRSFINQNHVLGRIKIISKFTENGEIGYLKSYATRLFPANIQYFGKVHEQIQSDLPRIKLPVEVQHDGYFEKNKSTRNIPILQQEIVNNPNDPYYYYQISKEFTGLQMDHLSFENLKKAYELLSKKESYAPALIVSYIYAIVSVKDWCEGLKVIDKEQVFLHDYADYYFVRGVFFMELMISNPVKYYSYLTEIEHSYLKCLEIGESESYDCVIGTGSYKAHHNLGVYYEVTGDINKAVHCYRQSATHLYQPSIDRLEQINHKY